MFQAEYKKDGLNKMTTGFETIEELEKYCLENEIENYRITAG